MSTPIQAKETHLTKRGGVFYYNGQKETYYNLNMSRIYAKADKNFGKHHKKWTREDLTLIATAEAELKADNNKHVGTWIDGKADAFGRSYVVCSECAKHASYSSEYCPNCGSHMEGGAK